jgi:hypothetical protein
VSSAPSRASISHKKGGFERSAADLPP